MLNSVLPLWLKILLFLSLLPCFVQKQCPASYGHPDEIAASNCYGRLPTYMMYIFIDTKYDFIAKKVRTQYVRTISDT